MIPVWKRSGLFMDTRWRSPAGATLRTAQPSDMGCHICYQPRRDDHRPHEQMLHAELGEHYQWLLPWLVNRRAGWGVVR
jgi:hypothetical protein